MPPTQEQRVKEFREHRKALGTQEEVAAMLDRSVWWIRDIEQGKKPCPMYAVYAVRWLIQNRP